MNRTAPASGTRSAASRALRGEARAAHLRAPTDRSHQRTLLERLDDPALAHRTAQIAMDGSQKLPSGCSARPATSCAPAGR
jgi:mannitol-1-phosphate/altronate dehydrogenase